VLGSMALVIVYALYIDCAKYWMHRLSHSIPLLWAVHSFHHSAERLTIATGARHHWADIIVLAPFYLLTVMLFQVPEHLLAMAILLLKVPDGLQHLNYKIAWHRAGLWINTPWWHRIHHSVEPEHYDKNFSTSFPIMDVIFGTAYHPTPDEYPETGLSTRENPNLWQGIIWPFRGWLAIPKPNEGGLFLWKRR
jgi:sterol desaturase/sphingolipid hydroxylase (fatty acid hydroxylase superfamily)